MDFSYSIQSDNGPSFTSEISQKIGQARPIQWELHASWRTQSMGETEEMNSTIKTLAKICQEKHLKWDQAPSIALLWRRAVPQSRLKLNLFEIVYERPSHVSVLGMSPLDLEHESKIKKICTTFRANSNNFAQGGSLQLYTCLTGSYTHPSWETKSC